MKWGLGVGAAVGVGVVARVAFPPRPSRELRPVSELIPELYDSMSESERAAATVPYDHPLRQFHNRGVDTGGVPAVTLGGTSRAHLVDLVHASLSEVGRERVPNQQLMGILGIHGCLLLFCGRPDEEHHQVHVTGGHLNLRIGGKNREGVAFGGPQVYGDQRGNAEVGLPGNVYRYQLEIGQRLLERMSPGERQVARLPTAPPQTAIEVQGVDGVFDGVAVADLSSDKRELVRLFVAGVLENYGEEDTAYAWQCIEANGGIDALRLSDYDIDFQGGRRAGDAPSQIIRIEGPGTVFHYRGEPHLHAFFNVARDGDAPLSLGEELGVNPVARRDTASVAELFAGVLRAQEGADLGFYPESSVAGWLRAGPIRSGDIYNLENWREDVAFLDVRGADIGGEARQALSREDRLRDDSTYRVATIGYVASDPEEFGFSRADGVSYGPMLRHAAIEHFRTEGFPA